MRRAENVVPLVSSGKADATVTAVLDAVSARLDTSTLTQLDTKVISDKQDPAQVGSQWLGSVGLG
jgi:osmoprotectant transport system substrate-binding protein